MMKALYYLFTACALISVAGCKKAGINNQLSSDTDNGCITRITKNYSVNATDSAAAAQLLQQNNIPTGNLVFTSVQFNDVITNVTGTNVYQHIRAFQKSNGLLIFDSDVIFHFQNRLYWLTTGQIYNATMNLSTSPKLTLPQVRKLYMNAASTDYSFRSTGLADSCLVAQFGYYDINAGSSTSGQNIVPAWSVTPQHSQYPIAYIRDDNKTLIYYFNGIIVN